MRWNCSISGFQILVLIITLLITLNVQAKKPEDIKPAPQPTRESLEKRIHELIDAAVRKDEKKIASMLLGGKGERYSWNRQVIWEYMAHQRSRDCKNITIYIVGYTAYTRFWCLTKRPTGQPTSPCPEREGESRYWVFRGGQWYMADRPSRNEDPSLQKEWLNFIEEHKNIPCLVNEDPKAITKTKEFMDYLMAGNLPEAAEMISRWCGRNSFNSSFDMDATRIDTLCLLYKYDFLKSSPPVSYEIDTQVEHRELPFSIEEEPNRTYFYITKVFLTRQDGNKSKLVLAWLKEGDDLKMWERWY